MQVLSNQPNGVGISSFQWRSYSQAYLPFGEGSDFTGTPRPFHSSNRQRAGSKSLLNPFHPLFLRCHRSYTGGLEHSISGQVLLISSRYEPIYCRNPGCMSLLYERKAAHSGCLLSCWQQSRKGKLFTSGFLTSDQVCSRSLRGRSPCIRRFCTFHAICSVLRRIVRLRVPSDLFARPNFELAHLSPAVHSTRARQRNTTESS